MVEWRHGSCVPSGCQRSGQAAPLDAAHRSCVSIGRLPCRGYVEPTQAVWELLEDAVEPANADIERWQRLSQLIRQIAEA